MALGGGLPGALVMPLAAEVMGTGCGRGRGRGEERGALAALKQRRRTLISFSAYKGTGKGVRVGRSTKACMF